MEPLPHPSQTVPSIPSEPETTWSSSLPCDISPREQAQLTESVLANLGVPREELIRARFESFEDRAAWPKLQRYIATDMLPDVLVLEQDSATHSPHHADPPLLYIRAHPQLAREQVTWSFADPRVLSKERAEPHVAHVWWDLDDPDAMSGTHGYVRRAAFTRRETVKEGQLATVTEQVLAKNAGLSCEAHRMLQNEAMLYSMFPRELMDTVSPGGQPPVVPKFYGFYVPRAVTEWVNFSDHAPCKLLQGKSGADWCRSNQALLLMENC